MAKNLQKTILVETDHADIIHDAQLDYYGTLLATASSDRTVKIFTVRDGKQCDNIQTLAKHAGPVWCVRWIHPSFPPNKLVTCGYDRQIIVWRETGSQWVPSYESEIHQSSVNSIDVSPVSYGLMIVAGSSDGHVSVHTFVKNSSKFVCKHTKAHTGGCNSVSWCKSANLAEWEKPTFASAGCDNNIIIWSVDPQSESGFTKIQTLSQHTDWVREVAWAPSPAQASVAVVASCSEDNNVIIWTYRRGEWQKADEISFNKRVWSCSWSIMGNILAVAQGEDEVQLFKEHHDGKWTQVSEIEN